MINVINIKMSNIKHVYIYILLVYHLSLDIVKRLKYLKNNVAMLC